MSISSTLVTIRFKTSSTCCSCCWASSAFVERETAPKGGHHSAPDSFWYSYCKPIDQSRSTTQSASESISLAVPYGRPAVRLGLQRRMVGDWLACSETQREGSGCRKEIEEGRSLHIGESGTGALYSVFMFVGKRSGETRATHRLEKQRPWTCFLF